MIVCIAMIDCPSDDLKQQRAVMHREKEGEKDVESHTKGSQSISRSRSCSLCPMTPCLRLGHFLHSVFEKKKIRVVFS